MTETTTDETRVDKGPRAAGIRWVVTLLIVVVVALGTPLLLLGMFLREEVEDPEAFVETAGVIIEEPGVQQAIATEVSTRLSAEIENRLGFALIPEAEIQSTMMTIIRSDQFRGAWDELMLEAHRGIKPVLYGGSTDTLAAQDGAVVIDLDNVARLAQQRLVAGGFDMLGLVDLNSAEWEFTVFQSPDLAEVQGIARFVDDAVPVAQIALPALVVLAFLIAPRRWRVVRWLAVGWALGALLIGLGLAVARVRYVAAVADLGVDEPAAIATYDALTGRLAWWNRIYFTAALVLLALSFLLSPWRQRWHDRAERRSPAGIRGPGQWIAGHRWDIVLAGFAIALAMLVWWPEPTRPVLVAVGGVVVAAVLLALLGGRGRRTDQQPREPAVTP